LLSLQNSEAQPGMDAISNLPVQAPSEKLVEWSDVGNFTILTLLIGGLYILLVSVIVLLIGSVGILSGLSL
jgi:hypothetical protein